MYVLSIVPGLLFTNRSSWSHLPCSVISLSVLFYVTTAAFTTEADNQICLHPWCSSFSHIPFAWEMKQCQGLQPPVLLKHQQRHSLSFALCSWRGRALPANGQDVTLLLGMWRIRLFGHNCAGIGDKTGPLYLVVQRGSQCGTKLFYAEYAE